MRISQLADAVVQGLQSLPTDLYLGLDKTEQDLHFFTSNKQVRQQHPSQGCRFSFVINNLRRDRQALSQMAQIIIDDLLDKVSDPVIKQIYDKLISGETHFTSRSMMQHAITSSIGNNILKDSGAGIFTKILGRSTAGLTYDDIAIPACISRATAASRRLQHHNPELWVKLRKYDYDMLYFLYEEPIRKLSY